MRQIFNQKFYKASDFELKVLRRVRFQIKIFTTRQILKKNKFLKSLILKKKLFLRNTILKKKLFLKSTILKKICTQKITFCFILPRKTRRFCVLRAL